MSGGLSHWIRSGGWSLLAYAIQILSAVVAGAIVFRALGESEFGRLSLVRQFLALVVVLIGLALERAVVRYVPELLKKGGSRSANRFVLGSLLFRLAAWLLIFLLGWMATPWLESWVAPDSSAAIRIALGTALAFSLYLHMRAAATARVAMRAVALATAAGSVLGLALTIFVLASGGGVEEILLANGAGLLFAALLLIPAALRLTDAEHEGASADSETGVSAARLRKYSMPFFGIALLNYVVHSATEVFFLGHYQGEAAAGHFKLGFDFAQRIVDFLPLALWEISVVGFSTIVISAPERLSGVLRDYLVLLYLAMSPVVALGIALSPSIFGILYGPGSENAVVVAQAYFLIAGLCAVGAPLGMIIYAREKVGLALGAYMIFAAVNVFLDFWMIPRMALMGAVLALGLAKLLAVLLMGLLAKREIGNLGLPLGFFLRLVPAAGLPLVWLLFDTHLDGITNLLVGLVVTAVLFLGGLKFGRAIGSEESALLRRSGLPGMTLFLRWMGSTTVSVRS